MIDDKTHSWITIMAVGAVTGLYGFFIRHIIGHPDQGAIDKNLDNKQDRAACDQIVKRIDENHAESNRKLDRILDYLEKGGPDGRVRT